jgi:hypothetical protein
MTRAEYIKKLKQHIGEYEKENSDIVKKAEFYSKLKEYDPSNKELIDREIKHLKKRKGDNQAAIDNLSSVLESL